MAILSQLPTVASANSNFGKRNMAINKLCLRCSVWYETDDGPDGVPRAREYNNGFLIYGSVSVRCVINHGNGYGIFTCRILLGDHRLNSRPVIATADGWPTHREAEWARYIMKQPSYIS